MAFDGFFVAALSAELNEALAGFRVEKVNCAFAAVEMRLYGNKTTKYLLLSPVPAANFVTVKETPALMANDTLTPFCLSLRKHLISGKIKSVTAVKNERILKFSFDSPDALGHLSEKVLVAEIMGKFSNLILVSEEEKMINSLYTSDLITHKRAVMPGLPYALPPPQAKRSAEDLGFDEFAALCGASRGKAAEQFLIDTFFCFSPQSARQTAFLAGGGNGETIEDIGAKRLYAAIQNVYQIIREKRLAPTAVYMGGKALDFSFMDMDSNWYGDGEKRHFTTLFELINVFFAEKAARNLLKSKTADLLKVVDKAKKRIEKKEALQREELAECVKKDDMRKRGELLAANIYRLKKGEKTLVAEDFETGEKIEIPLDPRLSPSQNAAKYFKKYRKYTNAEKAITGILVENAAEKRYLDSVLDCLNRAESEEDTRLIREELTLAGYIRKKEQKPVKSKVLPRAFQTQNGLVIKVGKNNVMNDTLVKTAEKTDVWFHVKGLPGSHVVLCAKGGAPCQDDMQKAADAAAYYSSARGDTHVGVDCTLIKNVKKPGGAKPGHVIYDKHRTMLGNGAKPPF